MTRTDTLRVRRTEGVFAVEPPDAGHETVNGAHRRSRWRRCGFAGLGLALAVQSWAGVAATLDADIRDLKWRALNLDADARVLEAGAESGARLSFYVGSAAPELVVRKIRVNIDRARTVVYELSDRESRAVLAGGLVPVELGILPTGAHQISAEVLARTPDIRSAAHYATLEAAIEVAGGHNAMLVELQAPGTFRGAELTWRMEALSAHTRAGSADPRARAALGLVAAGRAYDAAAELLALQGGAGGGEALGASLKAYGLPDRAASYGAGAPSPLTAGGAAGADALSLAKHDRDQLLAGERALHGGDAKAAVDAFKSVRSPGPFSTEALLGLGWAYLWPSMSHQDAEAVTGAAPLVGLSAAGEPEEKKRRLPLIGGLFSSTSGEQRAESLQLALVPWAELAGRDPLDPAVQEGMLALAYAIYHLGSQEQARGRYENAVNLFELSLRRLDSAAAEIGSGGMASRLQDYGQQPGRGWAWWLTDLPDEHWWLMPDESAPPDFYLSYLLASGPVRDSIQTYRDLVELDRSLAGHSQRLGALGDAQARTLRDRIEALRAQSAAVTAQQRAQMQQQSLAAIDALRAQTEAYLVEALFQQARMHDRPGVDNTLAAAEIDQ